jgi:hypothetical protein
LSGAPGDGNFKCNSILDVEKSAFGSCTPEGNCTDPRTADGGCPGGQVIDECIVGRCIELAGNPPTFTCEGEAKVRLLVGEGGCNDGEECTADGCEDGLCVYLTLEQSTCNGGGACAACKVGACEGVPPGTACDDANPCTDSDECADDDTCVGTICDTCTCDDQNACTTNDMCTGGVCVGTPVADVMPCDDGIACTVSTVCNDLGCVGGTLNDAACVTDDNPCTEQTCTSTGCRTTLITGMIPCSVMNGECHLGTQTCEVGSPTGGCVLNDPPELCP